MSRKLYIHKWQHFSGVTSRIWMYVVERLFLAEGSIHTYCACYFYLFNSIWFPLAVYTLFLQDIRLEISDFSRWLWLNHYKIILSFRLVCPHCYFYLVVSEYITVLLHQACKLIIFDFIQCVNYRYLNCLYFAHFRDLPCLWHTLWISEEMFLIVVDCRSAAWSMLESN